MNRIYLRILNIVGIALLFIACSNPRNQPEINPRSSPESVARAYVLVFAAGDCAQVNKLFAPDRQQDCARLNSNLKSIRIDNVVVRENAFGVNVILIGEFQYTFPSTTQANFTIDRYSIDVEEINGEWFIEFDREK